VPSPAKRSKAPPGFGQSGSLDSGSVITIRWFKLWRAALARPDEDVRAYANCGGN